VHLISKGISGASLNQVVRALRFFYGVTFGCEAKHPNSLRQDDDHITPNPSPFPPP
jgi:hypothetical protein